MRPDGLTDMRLRPLPHGRLMHEEPAATDVALKRADANGKYMYH